MERGSAKSRFVVAVRGSGSSVACFLRRSCGRVAIATTEPVVSARPIRSAKPGSRVCKNLGWSPRRDSNPRPLRTKEGVGWRPAEAGLLSLEGRQLWQNRFGGPFPTGASSLLRENFGSDLYPVRAGLSPRAVAGCATPSRSQATKPAPALGAVSRSSACGTMPARDRGALLPAVPRGWGSADAGWPIRPRRGGRSPPATPQHRPRRSQHPPRPVSPGRPALSCLGGVFGWCRSRRRLGLRPTGTSRRRLPSACRCRSCRLAGPGGPGPPSR